MMQALSTTNSESPMKKISSVLMALVSLNGCSIYKALDQPGPADLAGIGVGIPRQTIITKLGAPKMIDTTKEGLKQDVFEFQSGFHQASKARVILYLAGDVFTLGVG
jgi:hypothetical protein